VNPIPRTGSWSSVKDYLHNEGTMAVNDEDNDNEDKEMRYLV
jgi:hypothetical protein